MLVYCLEKRQHGNVEPMNLHQRQLTVVQATSGVAAVVINERMQVYSAHALSEPTGKATTPTRLPRDWPRVPVCETSGRTAPEAGLARRIASSVACEHSFLAHGPFAFGQQAWWL